VEDLGVKGRIILNMVFEKLNGGMEWTDLALERETWCALMKAVMNLRVPYVVTLDYLSNYYF
jgi:hypothetical protein